MRKEFLFFVLAIFFISIVSAVEVQIKENVNLGETFLVKVSGNFLENIQKSDISFYRRHMPTSFADYDIQQIGGGDYIYVAVATGKIPDNYSIQIKNIYYMEGATVKNTPIIGNFTILNKRADFSLTPGVVKTDIVFSVRIQNLQNKAINLGVYDGTNENYNLRSGEIKDLFFDVKSGIRIINFNSANQSYELYVENPVIILECTTNEECGIGNVCENNKCIANSSWCNSNAECGIGKMCLNHACVINESWCTTNYDCTEEEICTNHECIINQTTPECIYNSDCALGKMCVSGTCVINSSWCTTNEQCGTGKICVNNACAINESWCTTNDECGIGKLCVNNECVINYTNFNCSTNDECGIGKLCVNNACVVKINCTIDDDCAKGTICREGLCIENQTDFSCIMDEECNDGKLCVNNECVIDWTDFICEKDSQCGGEGRICIEEKCINEEDIIFINEDGEVKTCAEMSGKICEATTEKCDGNKSISADAECCLGKCIAKTSSNSKKIVGWVLIIIIVLIFAWFFLKKYRKTKNKKVDLEKESKGKKLPPLPPPKIP